MTLTEYVESRQGTNMMIMVFKERISQNELPDYLWKIIQEEVYIEFPPEPENQAPFWSSLCDSLA